MIEGALVLPPITAGKSPSVRMLARGDGRYPRLMRALGGVKLLILHDWVSSRSGRSNAATCWKSSNRCAFDRDQLVLQHAARVIHLLQAAVDGRC
jgi:hypothetical protein